ncbi:MAG: TRAP transporter large permease [Planctomycetaceae bacterium]|nr:TRAP transporter large permease [Planctomycetaceae bacterium]
MSAIILFGFLFIFIIIGLPIAYGILLSGSAFIILADFRNLLIVPQRLIRGLDSFPFLAIPLFIFAGYLLESNGMSRRLVNCVMAWFGGFRGSMAIVTIISCAIFAALTGSGPATVAAIGGIMLPAMTQSGYTKSRAAGIVAAGGALGPIIPPSIPMIIYGTTMSLSIPAMFIGSIIPGVLLMVIYITINQLYVGRRNIKSIGSEFTFTDRLRMTWNALGALIMPVIILGGIYGGVFTPTEAAAVAVVYALILGFATREQNVKSLREITVKTMLTTCTILMILGAGNLFTFLMAATGIPKTVSTALLPIMYSQEVFLIILSLLLFVAGALLDTPVAILLIAPILCPIGIELGIDPLHLGIVFCINLCVGYITPPFGMNLFTASSTTGEGFVSVAKGVLPFMIAAMLFVLILAMCPWLTLFLPGRM